MGNTKTITLESAGALLDSFAQRLASADLTPGFVRLARLPAAGAEVRVDSGQGQLILPVRPFLYPSRRLLTLKDELSHRLVLSPHLPEALAADLRAAGINHADLNGRLFIHAPSLVIDHGPRNQKHRSPAGTLDVFSGKACRITRALLANREGAFTQESLVARTGASRGLVSRALTWLTGNGYVECSAPGGKQASSYRVKDFDALLAAWGTADDWKKRCEIFEYSLLSGDALQTAAQLQAIYEEKDICFTQWIAAWLRRPYTTPVLASAYLRDRRLLDRAPGRRVNSGGNLWLIVPADEGVFLETQRVNGLPLVADVQIYLDLVKTGLRGPEAANELRNWEGFGR